MESLKGSTKCSPSLNDTEVSTAPNLSNTPRLPASTILRLEVKITKIIITAIIAGIAIFNGLEKPNPPPPPTSSNGSPSGVILLFRLDLKKSTIFILIYEYT
jgi:hypothetical protein